jgi:hypothetical protein
VASVERLQFYPIHISSKDVSSANSWNRSRTIGSVIANSTGNAALYIAQPEDWALSSRPMVTMDDLLPIPSAE